MTTRSDFEQGKNFDSEEPTQEELELSSLARMIAGLREISNQLRRVVVFAPAFGIVFLIIGFLWFQSFTEESRLKSEAEQLQILLDQPAPQPETLMSQAEGWDTAYQVVLANRVVRPHDSDLVESVIDAAADAGLVITETGTTLDSVATIENESYTATPLLISAIGTMDSIETYLQMLETSRFAAFGVEAASVEEGLVGYQLTLRGLFYSLPEDFGETADESDETIQVTPVVPVDAPVDGENGESE